MRERESDFERLVGQNLWTLESFVEHVGDFASSGKVETVPCGEEPTRVFPGAVFEILLLIRGSFGSAADLDCCSEIYQCPRRARTSGGAVGGRVRGRCREVAFFNDSRRGIFVASAYVENPDLWHEVSVASSFLSAVSVLTPDDDHMWSSWPERLWGPL